MSTVMGVRFHPTDAELINYLKRFFKGELFLSQECPIQFADIYGDQPPWEIFGSNSEENVRYFITPLKKRKSEYIRFCRTCAKGTWKGQAKEDPIRNNLKGPVVGFRRSFTFVTRECGQNKTWLMKEYYVADNFFRENNHIPKEDFVVCRIKRKINKEKEVNHAVEAQDVDVVGIIDAMLLEPNHNDYCTAEDQVREDEWDSIIDRICDEQDDHYEVVEDTTSSLHGEYDDQNSTYEATTMEKKDTTLEHEEIEQVQEGNGVDDIRSNEFREEMYRILEDIPVDIPDDWLQQSH